MPCLSSYPWQKGIWGLRECSWHTDRLPNIRPKILWSQRWPSALCAFISTVDAPPVSNPSTPQTPIQPRCGPARITQCWPEKSKKHGLTTCVCGVVLHRAQIAAENRRNTYPKPPVFGGAPVSPADMARTVVEKVARESSAGRATLTIEVRSILAVVWCGYKC